MSDELKAPKALPTVGRIVLYTLTAYDAESVNKTRSDAQSNLAKHEKASNGVIIHVGSEARQGDQLPMQITKVHEDGSVNGRVALDGNDVYWVEKIQEGVGEDHWCWPRLENVTPIRMTVRQVEGFSEEDVAQLKQFINYGLPMMRGEPGSGISSGRGTNVAAMEAAKAARHTPGSGQGSTVSDPLRIGSTMTRFRPRLGR